MISAHSHKERQIKGRKQSFNTVLHNDLQIRDYTRQVGWCLETDTIGFSLKTPRYWWPKWTWLTCLNSNAVELLLKETATIVCRHNIIALLHNQLLLQRQGKRTGTKSLLKLTINRPLTLTGFTVFIIVGCSVGYNV